MGTRSRERALMDRRMALGMDATRSRKDEERLHYNGISAGREFVNMESELRHWRRIYSDPEVLGTLSQSDVEPAIKLGLDAFLRTKGRSLRDVEQDLSNCYERTRGDSRLDWVEARPIVEAVMRRLHR